MSELPNIEEKETMDIERVDEGSDDDESGDNSEDDSEEVMEEENVDGPEAYIPGVTTEEIIAPSELDYDESAYDVYHVAQSGFPCLSFDIVSESGTVDPNKYPISVSFVSGTQAATRNDNHLMVIRMTKMHKVKQKKTDDEESEEDDEDDEEDDENEENEDEDRKPCMTSVSIGVDASINRVRQTKLGEKIFVASWIASGSVIIHDITTPMYGLWQGEGSIIVEQRAVKQFRGHRAEGFALDWSTTVPGRLLTGDCDKEIHLWEPVNHSGGWNVDQRSLQGHESSVEDIQWSPSEKNVFASCSSDKSIRIFDVRAAPHKANMLTTRNAHDADVNVINWNRNDPFLVSGGDDGVLKIWDLRHFKEKKTVATFKHHTAPITSVEWHPSDSSVFAACGADNQVTLWDLSVENDSETGDAGVPPQLLFIHLGQTDLKELHWHPQLPGLVLSTAESGFNVFKTISV